MLWFYNELMRRNVFKVAAVYAVVGWIITQIASVFSPDFGLPDGTGVFVLALVLVGFPVAVYLAWTYEVTPDGIKKTEQVKREASVTPATGRKLDFIIIITLVLALGYFLWGQQLSEPAPEPSGSPDSLETESGQN